MRSASISKDAPAGVANPSTRSAASRPTRKPPLHTVVSPFDRSEIVAYSPLPIFRTDAKPLSTSGDSETRASSATSANGSALSAIVFLLWSIRNRWWRAPAIKARRSAVRGSSAARGSRLGTHAWQRVHSSRLTGPFVERVGELLGHSRSHPDPLNRCAERKDDLAAAGRDSVSELALVVWGQGTLGESASLTQRDALGSRLRFHRLDRLCHLCLLHKFFEPPVPLVFIPLHHGLHLGRSSHRGSPPVVVSVSSLARTFCFLGRRPTLCGFPTEGSPAGVYM